MSSKSTHISQIKKYLAVDLDARAMHELERKALNDPFLMDALEGYERNGNDQLNNLDELSNRLHHRIQHKNRMVLWPGITMAASVLLVLGFGAWWLLVKQPAVLRPKPSSVARTTNKPKDTIVLPQRNKDNSRAQIAFEPIKSKPKTIRIAEPAIRHAAVEKSIGDNNIVSANASPKVDTTVNKLNDVVVTGYASQRKTTIMGSVSAVTTDSITVSQALAGRAAGVKIITKDGRPGSSPKLQIRGMNTPGTDSPLYVVDGVIANSIPDVKPTDIASVNVLKDASATALYGSRAAKGVILITTNKVYTVNGQVLSKTDKLPLAGVSVKVTGKGAYVTTDLHGHFSLKANKNDVLEFKYVGFEHQQVKVKSRDSLKIALNQQSMALAEVAVVGYGTPNNVIEEAHPLGGWGRFNKYLKANAMLPDGKTGVVKLTFVVNGDNSLSDFTITKSLSSESDQKAIELIKNGPAWQHNVSGQPEKVHLRIRFKN